VALSVAPTTDSSLVGNSFWRPKQFVFDWPEMCSREKERFRPSCRNAPEELNSVRKNPALAGMAVKDANFPPVRKARQEKALGFFFTRALL
jgi:hypothetical protein